jgi:hypothetical protein
MLDPITLAHWIMGDATMTKDGLLFCTDSFSYQDIVLLINVLILPYNLKCSIHKSNHQFRIYVFKESIPKLVSIVSIVKPHMHFSMLYKINL